jgi:hypothetical protein
LADYGRRMPSVILRHRRLLAWRHRPEQTTRDDQDDGAISGPKLG